MDGSNRGNKRAVKYNKWKESGVPWNTAIAIKDKERLSHKVPKQKPDFAAEFEKATLERALKEKPKVIPPTQGCRARRMDNRICGRKSIVRYHRWAPHPDTGIEVEIVTEFCAYHGELKDNVMRINWEREIIPS